MLRQCLLYSLICTASAAATLLAQLSGSDEPESGVEWIEEWLDDLVINIPEADIESNGLKVHIFPSHCNHVGIRSVDSQIVGPETVQLIGVGLKIFCDIKTTAKGYTLLTPTKINVKADIGENPKTGEETFFGGNLTFVPDGQKVVLPQAMEATCISQFTLKQRLSFSGSLTAVTLTILEPLLWSFVRGQLAKTLCNLVQGIFNEDGSYALGNTSIKLHDYIDTPSVTPSNPPPLPRPRSDFTDLSENPGIQLMTRVVDDVLGNRYSPYNLNNIFTKYLGPDGYFSVAQITGLLPFTTVISLADYGTLTATLVDLTVGQLNTWSQISLGIQGSRNLEFAVTLDKLDINVSLSLLIEPNPRSDNPLLGKALYEDFDLRLFARPISTTGDIFAAINQTHIKSLAFNQIAQPGCLIPVATHIVQVDAADVSLPYVRFAMLPRPDINGTLEHGLAHALEDTLDLFLEEFASGVEALVHHAVSVDVRDRLNLLIGKFQGLGDCGPPLTTFSSELVNVVASYIGIFLCAIALLSTCALLPLDFFSNRGQRSASPGLLGVSLQGIAERLRVDLEDRTQGGSSASSGSHLTLSPARQGEPDAEASAQAMPHAVAPRRGGLQSPENAPAVAVLDEGILRRAESDESDDGPPSWDCLAFNQDLSIGLRVGMPLAILGTIMLFVAADSYKGVYVALSITTNGRSVMEFPDLVSLSTVSTIHSLAQGGAWVMVTSLTLLSGIWPYIKLLLLLYCWFTPSTKLPVLRRQRVLDFLDAFGKWSLVDTYILVLPMAIAPFSYDLATIPPLDVILGEVDADLRINVTAEQTGAFHEFIFATLVSLVCGMVMSACHRYTLSIGEYAPCAESDFMEVKRLCDRLKSPGKAGHVFKHGATVMLSISWVLALSGIFVTTLSYHFEGLAGDFVPNSGLHSYSILSLTQSFAQASAQEPGPGVFWIQVFFFTFTAVTALLFIPVAIALWTARLSETQQRLMLIGAQALHACSALDVFVVTMGFVRLEVDKVADHFIIDFCAAVRQDLPDALREAFQCTDLVTIKSDVHAGYWILLAAAVLSSVTGQVTLWRCSRVLMAAPPRGRHSGSPTRRLSAMSPDHFRRSPRLGGASQSITASVPIRTVD